MGAVIQNGNFVGGLDAAVMAKIGTDTLHTSADDLSGAINEHEEDITEIKQSLSDLSTLTKTASGAIVTFDDGSNLPMPSLKVAIEPQQDLHGYDSPWVGGAGKNKLPLILDNIKANNTRGTWNGNTYVHPNGITFNIITNNSGAIEKIVATGTASDNAILFLDSATFKSWTGTFIINGCIEGSGSTYFWDMQAESSGNVIDYDGDTSFVPTQNYRPRIVIISGYQCPTNGITFKPMIRLASVTDATFAPYSNICPISGWDEVNVTRCGANIWDEEWEVGSITDNGSYSASSTIRSKNFTAVKPDTEYSINIPSGFMSPQFRVCFYDKNKTFINRTINPVSVFTIPLNCFYIKITGSTAYGVTYNNDISINYPSTDTSYHAYNGQTYTIDLDGTRYGGTLDVISGVLTVDRKFDTYTELDSQYGSVGPDIVCAFITVNDMLANSRENGISNYFIPTSTVINQNSPWKVSFGINNKRIFFTFDPVVIDGNTLEDINDYVALNPIQVVYPLDTPLTIQLTPTQVKSLVGENNIWADTGDIEELIYFRNTENVQAIRDIIDTTTAKDIAINTPDEMTATNVQEAIDEHTEMLAEQGEDISEIKQSLSDLTSKLVSVTLSYNSSSSGFIIPNDVLTPSTEQICCPTRNIQTGAIYICWYDKSIRGFRVGTTVSGNAPTNGQKCSFEYFA